MKQLSLLLLAGLTTGCFAAEQPRISCWDFVKMCRDPQYSTELKNSYSSDIDILTVGGFADCADNYDKVERLANDDKLNPEDRIILNGISKCLAKRLNRHAYSSLEAAIERDETNQARRQAISETLEEAKRHTENAKAILGL